MRREHTELTDSDARFSTGNYGLTTSPKCEYELVEVGGSDERKEALLALLRARQNRTMVFANTAAQAEGVRRLLDGSGVPCGLYHPNVPPEARRAALRALEAEGSGVLVCKACIYICIA